jgi:hypothetical protein
MDLDSSLRMRRRVPFFDETAVVLIPVGHALPAGISAGSIGYL